MTNSCRKGKRGENAAANFLTSLGLPAERNARNGKSEDDLVCSALPWLCFEVKRDQRVDVCTIDLDKAHAQATANADGMRMPVVLWRRNGSKEWRITYRGSHDELVTARARRPLLLRLNADAEPRTQSCCPTCGAVRESKE